MSRIKDLNNDIKVEEAKEVKSNVNPSKDKGNYIIQIINDGEILKQIIALNSTINVIYLNDQAVAADIK
jgi:hypothetical protein